MNRFTLHILLRVALITATIVLGACLWMQVTPVLGLICAVLLGVELYYLVYYISRINRKLTLFLESIRYGDFSIRFSADNKLGTSFAALNQQFNEVMEAFRQTRAEKEANLKYIDTIIQHISIGVLSFDASGKIELINPAAFRFLGIYRLRYITELKNSHENLSELLLGLASGKKILYQTQNGQQLSIHATAISLQGRAIKLLSIQNIHAELQQKELESWQNLARILRHEIMNSITPIVSLIDTMQEIVDMDIAPIIPAQEAVADLQEALSTIENRSKGIMNFVNAYRDYTTLPAPQFTLISVKTLVNDVYQLLLPALKKAGIGVTLSIQTDVEVHADISQMQMVLINLVKNAMDALEHTENPSISIITNLQGGQLVVISVADNGPGIDEDALDKIFIPFFTTKRTGSGIGLSLSQQIIQLHNGQLKVSSDPGKGSTFLVLLNS
ncbi:Histidine kinase-, DNA gyrase B-, and HSP90-like ATPase [Chitinophaga costaii]|uniref:histidine kinase n=1 Tax=Chitinophaga costaii TaxID=1335309 RepID=A0A1C4FQX8_9BACT|nr:ATP-binding protein [Chitinophaga costaii]PUZ20478.1 GHKL domain-containing protein [Chitinophaga costaii]SCC58399.1 Histidine kinase-, DNA gyrase B-, and HSP90-like ATPase [Chitinophaga costaii]